MQGIILAGGTGTRLRPLTLITNKHLLPVWQKPMIEYPIATFVKAGITDIMIVSGREHAGHFVNYLGSGRDRGLKFTYKVQEEAGGIAEALGLAEDFITSEKFAVILGDNVFEEDFSEIFKKFETLDTVNCAVFIKEVEFPHRFGVVQFQDDNNDPTIVKISRIIEKPKRPPSSWAVTGLYLYDKEAFNIIKRLIPSGRGELEITDLNNWYIMNREAIPAVVRGFWSDAGTFDSLLASSNWAQNYARKQQENR